MKLETYNYCQKTTTTPNCTCISIRLRGWSGWIASFFVFWGVTWACIQVALVDRFWRSLRHMTSFHASMCLLGGTVNIPPHLGDQIPRNRNRHFQAKRAKYSNFHVIKTTAWIATKFCTPVKTTKYASFVVQKHGKQIQDFEQIEKSYYLRNCLTDFDEIWHACIFNLWKLLNDNHKTHALGYTFKSGNCYI